MNAQGQKRPGPNYLWLLISQCLCMTGFVVGAFHSEHKLAEAIAGICLMAFLALPFCGIIMGHIACYRIKKATGISASKSGLIANYFIAIVIVFLTMNFMPGWLEARRKSQSRNCRDNIRVINAALVKHRADHTNGPAVVTLPNLVPGYIKIEPHCPNAPRKSYVIDSANGVHCPVEDKYPEHKATE